MGLETLSYAAFSHPPIFYCEKCGLDPGGLMSGKASAVGDWLVVALPPGGLNRGEAIAGCV